MLVLVLVGASAATVGSMGAMVVYGGRGRGQTQENNACADAARANREGEAAQEGAATRERRACRHPGSHVALASTPARAFLRASRRGKGRRR